MKINKRQLLDIPTWDKLHNNPHVSQEVTLPYHNIADIRLYQQRCLINLIGKEVDWLRGMQGESVTRGVSAVIFSKDNIILYLTPEL